MKKLFMILISLIMLFILPMQTLAEEQQGNYNYYLDIEEHWAKDVILDVSKRDLFDGYSDATFKPNKEISRIEFLTVLLRTLKKNHVLIPTELGYSIAIPYNDIESTYWGYKSVIGILGLVGGEEFKKIFGIQPAFDPNRSITRKEVAQLMALFNSHVTSNESISLTDVDEELLKNIQPMITAGIITGYEDNTFRPLDFITRGETAAVISRLDQWFQKDLNYEVIPIDGYTPAMSPFILMDSYTNRNSKDDQKVKELISELANDYYNEQKLKEFEALIHDLYDKGYWNKALVNFYKVYLADEELSTSEEVDLLIEAAEFVNEGGIDQPLAAGELIYTYLHIYSIDTPYEKMPIPYLKNWYNLITNLEISNNSSAGNGVFTNYVGLLTSSWLIEVGELEAAREIYEKHHFAGLSILYVSFHNYLYTAYETNALEDIEFAVRSGLEFFIQQGADFYIIREIALNGAKIMRKNQRGV